MAAYERISNARYYAEMTEDIGEITLKIDKDDVYYIREEIFKWSAEHAERCDKETLLEANNQTVLFLGRLIEEQVN